MSLQEASMIRLGLCDRCNGLHVFLCDDAGEPFAVGVLPFEAIPGFVKDIQNNAYAIAARKDEK